MSASSGFPLPDNVILNIFGRLDVHDLVNLAQTCHKFHRLVQNPVLWKALACKHFLFVRKDNSLKPSDWSWKHFFKQLYVYDVTWENGYLYKKKMTGHLMSVNALCMAKLKHQVVSGSSDHTLILWDWKTGEQLRTFRGHALAVRSVHMDEVRIVSGSNDKTVRVWDPATGECTAVLEGHEDCVTAVRSDAKKNVIVSGSFDYSVKVWDATSGKCTATLTGHTNIVKCLCLRSHRILSGSVDCTVKVWNIGASECMLTLKGHTDTVTCVECDSEKIISGSHDRTIRLWNLRTGEHIKTLRMAGAAAMVETLAFDNAKIVAGTRNGSIYIFSMYTLTCSRIVDAHSKAVNCLQFNNKIVASASADCNVLITRFSTKQHNPKVKMYANKGMRASPYTTGSTKVPAGGKGDSKSGGGKPPQDPSSARTGGGQKSARHRRARQAEKEVYTARQGPRTAFATPDKNESHEPAPPMDSGGRDPYGWGAKGPPKSHRVMHAHEDPYEDGRKPWDATVTVNLEPIEDRPLYEQANPYATGPPRGRRQKKQLAPLYSTHPPRGAKKQSRRGKKKHRGGDSAAKKKGGDEASHPFQEKGDGGRKKGSQGGRHGGEGEGGQPLDPVEKEQFLQELAALRERIARLEAHEDGQGQGQSQGQSQSQPQGQSQSQSQSQSQAQAQGGSQNGEASAGGKRAGQNNAQESASGDSRNDSNGNGATASKADGQGPAESQAGGKKGSQKSGKANTESTAGKKGGKQTSRDDDAKTAAGTAGKKSTAAADSEETAGGNAKGSGKASKKGSKGASAAAAQSDAAGDAATAEEGATDAKKGKGASGNEADSAEQSSKASVAQDKDSTGADTAAAEGDEHESANADASNADASAQGSAQGSAAADSKGDAGVDNGEAGAGGEEEGESAEAAAEREAQEKEAARLAKEEEEAAAARRLEELEREREGFQQDLVKHTRELRNNVKSHKSLASESHSFSFHFMCSPDIVEDVEPIMDGEVWPDIRNYVVRERPDLTFNQDARPFGSTNAMTTNSEVQLLRLDLVDSCKPFFICVLGAECGDPIQSWDKNLLASYPWLSDHENSSLIEVEIYHGVLTVGRPLFYFIDYLDTPIDDQMAALRERIVQSGLPWVSIRSPDQLPAETAQDVARMLQYEFPPVESLNGGVVEIDQYHRDYAVNRASKTITRKGALKRLTESLLNFDKAQSKPSALYSERPGSGCSTMISQWLVENNGLDIEPKSSRFVFYHFAGQSRYAQSVENMAFRLIHACDKYMDIAGAPLPHGYTTSEIVKELIPRLHGVANMAKTVIVFIDGFDQMDRRSLDWLPPTLPSNLRIVFSVGSDADLTQEVRNKRWTGYVVPQLSDKEVGHFTKTFLKQAQRLRDDPERKITLTDDIVDAMTKEVLSAPKPRITNVLSLRLLCLMLAKGVQAGGKADMKQLMKRFLVAKTPEHLYDRIIAGILAREEKSGHVPFFSQALQYTHQSVFGLSEADLLHISGTSRSKFTAALRGYHGVLFNDIGDIADLLNPNNSSLRIALNKAFFPSQLTATSLARQTKAAQTKVAADRSREVSDSLLTHFAHLVLPDDEEATIDTIASAHEDLVMAQMACEMGYHLHNLGEDGRLATITLEPRVFRAMSASAVKSDLVRWWMGLSASRDPSKLSWAQYAVIHEAHSTDEATFPILRDYAIDIGDFLTVQYRFGGAEKFFLVALSLESRIAEIKNVTNTKEQALIMGKVATVWRTHGMVDNAADYYFQGYEIYNELIGLNKLTVDMLIGLGEVEIEINPQAAETHLELAVTLLERLGLDSHPDYARCLNNLGLACKKAKNDEKAEDYYRRCLEIRLHTQGEWHPHTALVQRNLGSLLFTLKNYEESLGLFQSSLRTCKQVYGPIHPSTATSMKWVGGILTILGRKEEGDAMLKEAKLITAQSERAQKKAMALHKNKPSTPESQSGSAGPQPQPPSSAPPEKGNRRPNIREKVLAGDSKDDGKHVDEETADGAALAEEPDPEILQQAQAVESDSVGK